MFDTFICSKTSVPIDQDNSSIGQNFPAKIVSLWDIFDADIGKASEENSRDMLNIRRAARAI